MNDSDLIHLISNQILNQNVTENNKLVIQDCCKELFIKKCDKYKKVTYIRSRSNCVICFKCGSSQEAWNCDNCSASCDDIAPNRVKTRIVEVIDKGGTFKGHFPEYIYKTIIDKFEECGYYNFDDGESGCCIKTYTIIKIGNI